MLSIKQNSFPSYSIRVFGSWDEIIGDNLPQCNCEGISVQVSLGAGWVEFFAPGFEGCMDAPGFIPCGSHKAATFANVWD